MCIPGPTMDTGRKVFVVFLADDSGLFGESDKRGILAASISTFNRTREEFFTIIGFLYSPFALRPKRFFSSLCRYPYALKALLGDDYNSTHFLLKRRQRYFCRRSPEKKRIFSILGQHRYTHRGDT